MTVAIVVLGVVLVVAVLSSFLTVRLLTLDRRRAESSWARERSELLERIQRPEMRPAAQPVYEFEAPEREREPDDWANVGTIRIDDQYGLDDE